MKILVQSFSMLRQMAASVACVAAICLTCPLPNMAQGTQADYARADYIKEQVKDKILYAPDRFQWMEKEPRFWYLTQTPRGKEYMLVDAVKHSRQPAFDQAKLAAALTTATSKKVDPYALPFLNITYTDGGNAIEFTSGDIVWRYEPATAKLTEKSKVPVSQVAARYWGDGQDDMSSRPIKSPDGKWSAYIKNYNVYVQSADKKEEYPLSFDGSEGEYYAAYIAWSPDSKKLAVNRVRPNKPHLVYLIESSPADQFQPKLHTRNYLKPGDALPQKQPVLFDVVSRKQFTIDPSLIANQYSLSNPVWRKDSRGFTVEYNQRGHQVFKVIEVSGNGSPKELIGEQSKTFFEYSGKKFRYDVEDGKEIIWMSERDGWNHLYLYDGTTGKVKNQVTNGEWVVRNVVKVDEKNRTIFFAASGREAGQDPYLVQYFRVGFDGKGLVALTPENGNHLASFSDDYTYLVDSWSRIDQPAVTVLKSAVDGKVIMELEKSDIRGLLATGWKMPEVFTSKGRDGKTDIWGMIIRPANFDPGKTYPVIEYIYAGPQSAFVPKSFATDSRGDLHQLVELGFIVVQIDGMGTSNRSKAFHDVCYQNLKDGGFPDRILWMKAAAKKYPYMDLSRVGIFGNSAGGQNSAGALLFHPDFYKVAVSSSGCHDNRMDKMWWNELWMGYPIGPQYEASSNVTNAHKLKGQLLLILGELDDNVDPSSSMQLMNALIKSNKHYDFLMVPGMGHSMGGDYGEHKRRDFFVKHLIGVDPPEWPGQERISQK
ncbi:S9 family peptidase [Segetibacter sp. 3557_3]|uniref:S9 family peptidase n=1 Tax=Segetibacter sp. 3557_3 TaxID=2547429 RepID=UPI001058B09A|nr:S9 family peptidase [Segetibacter sp. 3557_3]TDH26590.1 S9 family peptidase [Segetibacter sp. 3557_3]